MSVQRTRPRSPSGHAVYTMGAGLKKVEPANNSSDYVWEVRAVAGKQLEPQSASIDLTVGSGDTLRRKFVREYHDGSLEATTTQTHASSTTQNIGPQGFLDPEPDPQKRIVAWRLYAWHDSDIAESSVTATRARIHEKV